MIKFIIFDLDGVLIEAKEIHYRALNLAIQEVAGKEFIIDLNEHLSTYDGMKTFQKLELLSKRKGLQTDLHNEIWKKKQEITLEFLSNVKQNDRLIDLFKLLRGQGYRVGCCSNSIRHSTLTMLKKIGLTKHLDIVLSNEDVKNSKPYPEIYWKAMSLMRELPEETLIVEDSPIGLLAANRSGAHILRVSSPADLTYSKLFNKLQEIEKIMINPKWQGGNLNVIIPMAGAGTRFQQAGYSFPKPLIDVKGKPMIQVVVENLNIEANYIYIVQKEHRERYNLDMLLELITPGCKIVEVSSITEGAACTVLLGKDYINNENPLLVVNSDQFIEWNSNEFMYKVIEQDVDGGILTFKSIHPKWSFAKVNESGYVVEVAEKKPISDNATVGIYYWKEGSDFVKYAERMIKNNIRVNNEFYVCPVFNEAIEDNKKIKIFQIERMWGLGTPEDLQYFLKEYTK